MNDCHTQPPGCVSRANAEQKKADTQDSTRHVIPFTWNSWTCRPTYDVRNKDCKLLGVRASDWEGARAASCLQCQRWRFSSALDSVTLGFRWYFHVCKVFIKSVLCWNPLFINKEMTARISKRKHPAASLQYSANTSPSSCWWNRMIISGWVTAGLPEGQEQILAF